MCVCASYLTVVQSRGRLRCCTGGGCWKLCAERHAETAIEKEKKLTLASIGSRHFTEWKRRRIGFEHIQHVSPTRWRWLGGSSASQLRNGNDAGGGEPSTSCAVRRRRTTADAAATGHRRARQKGPRARHRPQRLAASAATATATTTAAAAR